MELTHPQKKEIWDNGYVRVAGVVPRIMVDQALRAINHSVGQGMNVDEMTKFRAQSFCPDVQRTLPVMDLLHGTPAWGLAEAALGTGRVRPPGGGQIALRFPSLQDPPGPPRPHIDGTYSPTNGVAKGTLGSFTMLLAVFLSDLPAPNAGNFTVWPGSHRVCADYLREHGPEALIPGMPPLDLPEPEQIMAQAGDIALCHYLLAHSVAPNVSPHVRYAIFFRLHHVDHEAHKMEVQTDLWREWEGMGAFAGEKIAP